MNIVFNSIEINNFFAFEHAEINLKNNGYTLVEGINNASDDLAVSNGSGKSSIFEALCWGLTGQTIRGTKDVCNLYTNDLTSVKVNMDVDGVNYEIIRTKNKKNQSGLSLFVNGEDKSGKGVKDTESILQQYLLDLSSSMISSVIILGQGLPQRFTNNTPAGRKEILEKLSNSDFMIYDMKVRINERKTALQTKIRELEDEILRLDTTIDLLKDSIVSKELELNNLKSEDYLTSSIKSSSFEVSELQKEISILLDEIKKDSDEKVELEKSISVIKVDKLEELEKLTVGIDDEIDLDNKFVIKFRERQSFLKNEITKKKSIKDVCPTCGQKLPHVVVPDVSEELKELDELQNSIEKLNEELAELKNNRNKVVSDLDKKYEKLCSEFNAGLVSINKRIADNNSVLATLQPKLEQCNNKLTSLKIELTNYSINKNNLIDQIKELKAQLYGLKDKKLYYNNDTTTYEERLSIINRFSSVVNKEFRGYLLSTIIDFIDAKAKEYCKDIFETDKISFKLDGNNISISYKGKEYENLSGGERQKIDLIIQFSIRDMLCKYMKFNSNILVVDELFDNLDSIGCEKIIQFISRKLSDVDSIYIITHHSDISIPFDTRIVVYKGDDNISRIK